MPKRVLKKGVTQFSSLLRGATRIEYPALPGAATGQDDGADSRMPDCAGRTILYRKLCTEHDPTRPQDDVIYCEPGFRREYVYAPIGECLAVATATLYCPAESSHRIVVRNNLYLSTAGVWRWRQRRLIRLVCGGSWHSALRTVRGRAGEQGAGCGPSPERLE